MFITVGLFASAPALLLCHILIVSNAFAILIPLLGSPAPSSPPSFGAIYSCIFTPTKSFTYCCTCTVGAKTVIVCVKVIILCFRLCRYQQTNLFVVLPNPICILEFGTWDLYRYLAQQNLPVPSRICVIIRQCNSITSKILVVSMHLRNPQLHVCVCLKALYQTSSVLHLTQFQYHLFRLEFQLR